MPRLRCRVVRLDVQHARLVPLAPAVKPKKFGTLKGKIDAPDDFNDPLPDDVLESFGFDLAK